MNNDILHEGMNSVKGKKLNILNKWDNWKIISVLSRVKQGKDLTKSHKTSIIKMTYSVTYTYTVSV